MKIASNKRDSKLGFRNKTRDYRIDAIVKKTRKIKDQNDDSERERER